LADEVLTLGVAIAGLSLMGIWAVLYQLVKQQGRLLLRLDDFEERFARAPHFVADPTVGNGQAQRAPSAGLPVGTTLESFRLPDLEGKTVALEDFRGKRVLLVHWSPQCGFCHRVAPDLAGLQSDLRKANVELLLASYGDAADNRPLAEENGLRAPILLQDKPHIEAFAHLGTPVAYLLDEQGRVAEPLAVGADRVPELARRAADRKRTRLPGERDLSHSRIRRDGLPAGSTAPTFTLPDVRGGQLSLQDLRGKRVLLTFSDPHCGPCDALVPDLVRLHRQLQEEGCEIVMVGRGDMEENRRKAEEHGIDFPVVVQDHWKLSRAYGIFATPVAFLIDERGVIAADVARGAEQIVALAKEGLGSRRGAGNGPALR